MPAYLTAAFYKFVDLPDAAQLKAPLLACCERHAVKGLILLASEGINSTIAGPAEGVKAVLAYLRQDPRLADLQQKESWSERAPFYRMKVRLKKGNRHARGARRQPDPPGRHLCQAARLERAAQRPGAGAGGHPQRRRSGLGQLCRGA